MKVLGIIALGASLLFGAACLYGLFLMLLMGVLHSAFPAVPPLGYWLSVAIATLFAVLTGGFSLTYER